MIGSGRIASGAREWISKNMAPRKKKLTGGSLNSKVPNPFELAYKELWDKLPRWKQNAFAEDIANKRTDWGLYDEFIQQVNARAEQLYLEKEKIDTVAATK
jgi:hypothetical protein